MPFTILPETFRVLESIQRQLVENNVYWTTSMSAAEATLRGLVGPELARNVMRKIELAGARLTTDLEVKVAQAMRTGEWPDDN